jgi:ATP-dependent exoDNAse (exonuclease V) beta subunit
MRWPDLKSKMVDGQRFYLTPSGQPYPSITTVLSILSEEGIAQWKQRVGEEEAQKKSDHACERGTALHQAIEDYIANREVVFPTEKRSTIRMMFKRLQPKLDRIDNVIAQEIALYSDRLMVAGRCDCIAEFDGVLSIIDFKSAAKMKKPEHIQGYFQQASAYACMFRERTGIRIRQIVVLMCGEEDFSCQVFVERVDPFIPQLVNTIEQFVQRFLS